MFITMPVVERSEALLTVNDLSIDVAGVVSQPVTVSRTAFECGFEYSLGWGDDPLEPVTAYSILHATAPNPLGDTPFGVIDDWAEADRQNPEAKARIKRHERMLGQNWHDFMKSRLLLMEVVGAVPELGPGEYEVREITTLDEKAAFAAAYSIDPNNADTTLQIFDNAELDETTRKTLFGTLSPFLMRPEYRWDIGYRPYTIKEDAQTEALEALKQKLLELPPEITERIIQSVIKPALELDSFGFKQWDYDKNDFKRELIGPSILFTRRYCVQAFRSENGNLRAIPFTKVRGGFTFNYGIWLIPESTPFQEQERNCSIRRGAALISPTTQRNHGSLLTDPYSRFYDQAIESGSMQALPDASRVRPIIRWRTAADGTREFVLDDEVDESDGHRVITSGIFGMVLAAAVQPELTASWEPEQHGQPMGVAQLPVLALIHRERLVNSSLLQRAEQLAWLP